MWVFNGTTHIYIPIEPDIQKHSHVLLMVLLKGLQGARVVALKPIISHEQEVPYIAHKRQTNTYI